MEVVAQSQGSICTARTAHQAGVHTRAVQHMVLLMYLTWNSDHGSCREALGKHLLHYQWVGGSWMGPNMGNCCTVRA